MMDKEQSFDRASFKAYLKKTRGCEGYAADIVDSIIDYGHAHEHVSLDMFAYYVTDMLPSVEFKEVAAFCSDEILTKDGQRAKREFWATATA